ncbi:HAUS augmin-like complex subunit 8 [Rhinophrynus dorsalis]
MAEAGVAVSEDGSQNSSGGSSGDAAIKKNKGAKVVKSRYMQIGKSKVAKKNLANVTVCSGGKVPERGSSGTPTRRSVAPQKVTSVPGVPFSALDGSLFGKDDLQSTLLDGHKIVRPDFDLSVINDKTMQRPTPKSTIPEQRKPKRDATPTNIVPDDMIEMIESQTLLLTYLTMKMQKNLSRLEEKAERNLLLVNEEKDQLQEKVHRLKRERSLLQREKQLSDLLEKQADALAPTIEAKEPFKHNYRTFATALDCTRHQLPIKDIHVMGNRQKYLEELQKHLSSTLSLLEETMPSYAGENADSLSTIKELENIVLKTDEELSRSFRQVLDLSFKANKEISLQSQKAVEDNCELEVVRQWYFDQALP